MKLLKEFMNYLKSERRQDKERKRLLSERLDYTFLQKMLNEMTFNDDLVITITLKSGEIITMKKEQDKQHYNKGLDGNEGYTIS